MNELRMDTLDQRLIAELCGDPRMSFADLGKRLGVSGMTAATRLKRLRDAGLLEVRAVPNLGQLGLANEVEGFAQVEIAAMPAVIELLARSPYILEVSRVTGEFDLNFHAVFPSEMLLGELVRELQAQEGVRRVVIHHVLDRIKRADGWSAVFVEETPAEDVAYEVSPGTR